MPTKPFPTRRKFRGEWDEIKYLRQKLLYWLYECGDHRRSLRYADRLEHVLEKASPDHEAILGEECWSLVSEARSDLSSAIKYRENEIRLIKRLWKITTDAEQRDFVLQNYGPADLSDRLDLLAILYHDAGNLDRAIQTLRQSEQLCKEHGIPFDGRDVLEKYLAERNRAAAQ